MKFGVQAFFSPKLFCKTCTANSAGLGLLLLVLGMVLLLLYLVIIYLAVRDMQAPTCAAGFRASCWRLFHF